MTNHNYFDSIDTEYKAYILGFIYADGCITNNLNGRQKRLDISIQEEDGYILNKLAMDIRGTVPIKRYTPSQIRNNEKPQSKFTVSSDKLCGDLISMGCLIKKTTNGMTLPNLPKELISHFIRGFFDGDGSIVVDLVKRRYQRKCTYKIPNPAPPFKIRHRIYFTSTDKVFLENIEYYLKSLGLTGKTQWRTVVKKQMIYTMGFEKKSDIPLIQNYLYKDANYYLKRKYDKFNMPISSQAEDTSSEGSETRGEL